MIVQVLNRDGSAKGSTIGQGQIGAWHRAMPFTRLVDCGMDHADARELLTRTADGEAWDAVAGSIADRQAQRSELAHAQGHAITALSAARFAAAAYNFAQMAHNTDTEVRVQQYRRFSDTLRTVATRSSDRLHEIKIAYQDAELTGWLSLPATDKPLGTVIMWGGLSGWGGTYLNNADALNARGIAVILAEGPGQGTPRMEHRLYLNAETLDGFSAFLDAVEADARLSGPVGIQGNSFGGLFAAHVATRESRVTACVINGAPARPPVPEFRNAREQLLSLIGVEGAEPAEQTVSALHFEPTTQRIAVPTLVLQGGADPLATPEAQAPFAEALDHPDSQVLIWPDGEHTLYNHAAERDALVADWFADQFCITAQQQKGKTS